MLVTKGIIHCNGNLFILNHSSTFMDIIKDNMVRLVVVIVVVKVFYNLNRSEKITLRIMRWQIRCCTYLTQIMDVF